ncbi:MAG TPA: 4-oxalomesaconate tautomerase [Eudoraea sp.]|nr:4-oxalomesaconate tautomerase [Eudoraea sp.]
MIDRIPYMQIRGGSSKGIYFRAEDLPADETERDRLILAAMEGAGPGDLRQIDGLGGATSLTSKVAVVSPSNTGDADLDYLFLQVVLGESRLSASQNCGNILAGVLPFAIESGMLHADSPITVSTIKMLNSTSYCEVTLQTPDGQIATEGDTKVDGVPGTGAPVICNYLDTTGANTGNLLPTGNLIDMVDGIEMTCIDNGIPVVHIRAADLNITGYESREELDQNEELKTQLEAIRLRLGPLMKLGDVSGKTVPKMCLLSEAKQGGLVNTRSFIPHSCHAAIGVLAAFSTAAACILKGSVAERIASHPITLDKLSLEHPTGEFSVSLEVEGSGKNLRIIKSGAIRTARIISKGEVFIP